MKAHSTTTAPTADRWNADRWRLSTLSGRYRAWVRASRWRRRVVRLIVTFTVLIVVPALIGATAQAQGSGSRPGRGPNSALSWSDVRDSNGVPLANYWFVTSDGSLFAPKRTIVAMLLEIEFVGWLLIVGLAIWVIGYGMSFNWLTLFDDALSGVADRFAGQLAAPVVLLAAVTVGAFFVAYFVARGYAAKAARQIVTMLIVAILGVSFLADPLGKVFASDGLLVQGRDVGISVAAGLNGNASPQASEVVSGLQAILADNFVRRPLQVWNFGHVLDDRGSCASAWNSGMEAGDVDYVKRGLGSCGDYTAVEAVDNPGFWQLGTGLALLLCGCILVLFAAWLAVKVIRSTVDVIYHGFLAIFGFAAGGYIYGPTQTFLLRNVVDSVFAAIAMAAYSVFLGVYVLFLGNLFQEAGENVFAVLMIGAIVEVIAIIQIRRLAAGIERGGEWVANRFAAAAQGVDGGAALGTGPGATSHALSGIRFMSMISAMNTMDGNPLFARMFRANHPMSLDAQGKRVVDLQNIAIAKAGYPMELQENLAHIRAMADLAARVRAGAYGGLQSMDGIMQALDGQGDLLGGDNATKMASLIRLAANPEMVREALVQKAKMAATESPALTAFMPAVHAETAVDLVSNARYNANPLAADAANALLSVATSNLHGNTPRIHNRDRSDVDEALSADIVRAAFERGDMLETIHMRPGDSRFQMRRAGLAAMRDAHGDTLRDAGMTLVDDFTKKVKDYRLDPTAENFQRVSEGIRAIRRFDAVTNHARENPWSGPTTDPSALEEHAAMEEGETQPPAPGSGTRGSNIGGI